MITEETADRLKINIYEKNLSETSQSMITEETNDWIDSLWQCRNEFVWHLDTLIEFLRAVSGTLHVSFVCHKCHQTDKATIYMFQELRRREIE